MELMVEELEVHPAIGSSCSSRRVDMRQHVHELRRLFVPVHVRYFFSSSSRIFVSTVKAMSVAGSISHIEPEMQWKHVGNGS